MAEAATDQFGKATLKTMDKAYKIENATRKAGTKLDEAGMKAFEKVYDVAKKAGPGAAGLVAGPKTTQRAYDAISSYLPGGPPAGNKSGAAGFATGKYQDRIKAGMKRLGNSLHSPKSDFSVASEYLAQSKHNQEGKPQ